MANALFDPGREGFLDGSISWTGDTIKASLMRGYTSAQFSAAHKFVNDVITAGTGTGTIVATYTLTGGTKTATNGVANYSIPFDFGTVAPGAAITSMIIYKDNSSSNATARLIAFVDTLAGPTAMNITPNNTQITWTPDSGANKIFKL